MWCYSVQTGRFLFLFILQTAKLTETISGLLPPTTIIPHLFSLISYKNDNNNEKKKVKKKMNKYYYYHYYKLRIQLGFQVWKFAIIDKNFLQPHPVAFISVLRFVSKAVFLLKVESTILPNSIQKTSILKVVCLWSCRKDPTKHEFRPFTNQHHDVVIS